MIFRDGWYYLLVTHGSCCAGANSTYNIRMGRARKVTGPFLDNMGIDMLQGGGKLFLGSSGRYIGPGHFGLLDLGDGVQKFSLPLRSRPRSRRHQRARHPPAALARRLARGGRQLQGRHLPDRIRAHGHGARTGGAGRAGRRAAWTRRRGGPRSGGRGGEAGRGDGAGGEPIPSQDAAQVSANWPAGPVDVRMSPYMLQAQQKWTVTPVAECRRLSRIAVFQDHHRRHRSRAGGDATISELVVLAAFTGGPEQLWRIDQLADGTYRVMPKTRPELEGAAGALGRRQQHADAGQVHARQRSAALAVQDAVSRQNIPSVAGDRRRACRRLAVAAAQAQSTAARVPRQRSRVRRRLPKRRTPTGSCSAGSSSNRFA